MYSRVSIARLRAAPQLGTRVLRTSALLRAASGLQYAPQRSSLRMFTAAAAPAPAPAPPSPAEKSESDVVGKAPESPPKKAPESPFGWKSVGALFVCGGLALLYYQYEIEKKRTQGAFVVV
jgi:hypothetical protein